MNSPHFLHGRKRSPRRGSSTSTMSTCDFDETEPMSPMPSALLALSDEILLLIVQQLDRHNELPKARLTCRKLKELSDLYMYRNVMVTLPETCGKDWDIKLQIMPHGMVETKHLTILNQALAPNGYFHRDVICSPHSYRLLRWRLMEKAAEDCETFFGRSAILKGSLANWDLRLKQDQLSSFRWRHATPLSLDILEGILHKQSGSLQCLEVSMITPPYAETVQKFTKMIQATQFPKLKSLIYNGLSHTEPIAVNNPEIGGRFRMVRPLFRKVYGTLEELVLSQDHCVSQIGKTPLINGRVFDDLLCDLDEIYQHPSDMIDTGPITLQVSKLELGGFKLDQYFMPAGDPDDFPLVRFQLEKLRRLVLNECDGLSALLIQLTGRREDLKLTDVGFRIQEQPEDSNTESWDDLAEDLLSFLTCFKGLHLLSVLWQGSHAPDASKLSAALETHKDTLEVYKYAAREDIGRAPELRFSTQPMTLTPWSKVLSKSKRPKLKEFALDLHGTLAKMTYPPLRLLSQYKVLRTVHIQNFPPIQATGDTKQSLFWRARDGTVGSEALKMAAEMAELIALPFYGLPAEMENDEDVAKVIKDFDLQALADQHATLRDSRLCDGVKLRPIIHTSTPVRDLTRHILEQTAEKDASFARILHNVRNEQAEPAEVEYYNKYYNTVQQVLGYHKPSRVNRPRLRLLIVGEWRYRDQMNLTGPRTWDPAAWSSVPDPNKPIASPPSLGNDSDEDADDFYDEIHGLTSPRTQNLRHGFFKEFDVSLLPIFFEIKWRAKKNPLDGRYKWKPKVKVLPQTTLEGYGALSDVRSLDFAWQN